MDRLISEQAVIDRLSHWYSDMLETNKEQEDLIEVIKAIPSAEPKTGHWIDDTDKRAWKCSECGWWYRDWKRHNFCPYCGAKMIEPNMSENSIDSKDVIWYSKRNYSEIVVEPQERSEE